MRTSCKTFPMRACNSQTCPQMHARLQSFDGSSMMLRHRVTISIQPNAAASTNDVTRARASALKMPLKPTLSDGGHLAVNRRRLFCSSCLYAHLWAHLLYCVCVTIANRVAYASELTEIPIKKKNLHSETDDRFGLLRFMVMH